VSHILHSATVLLRKVSFRSPLQGLESYQTRPNHPRHSKFTQAGSTLVMLWFLRGPLMVRTAFIAGLTILWFATFAGAARVGTVRHSAHASAHSAGHHPHHAAKAASHSAHSRARSTHAKKSRHASTVSSRSTHARHAA